VVRVIRDHDGNYLVPDDQMVYDLSAIEGDMPRIEEVSDFEERDPLEEDLLPVTEKRESHEEHPPHEEPTDGDLSELTAC
jgi:hypothetical protein